MKLIMESWKRFLNEEKIQEGILSRVKSKLQRSFGKEVVSGRITPFPAGEGNWLEISVPYSEADVDTISQDTLLFLAIVDKMAEELGFKEPVRLKPGRRRRRWAPFLTKFLTRMMLSSKPENTLRVI